MNTRENVIELLKSMEKHSLKMANIFKESGEYEIARQYVAEAGAYFDAIRLLESKEYFNNQNKIFKAVTDNDNQV